MTFTSSKEWSEGVHCNIKQGYLQRQPDDELLLLVVDLPVVQEQLEVALVVAQHAVELHSAVPLEVEVVGRVPRAPLLLGARALGGNAGVHDERLHEGGAQIHGLYASRALPTRTAVIVALTEVLRDDGAGASDGGRGHGGAAHEGDAVVVVAGAAAVPLAQRLGGVGHTRGHNIGLDSAVDACDSGLPWGVRIASGGEIGDVVLAVRDLEVVAVHGADGEGVLGEGGRRDGVEATTERRGADVPLFSLVSGGEEDEHVVVSPDVLVDLLAEVIVVGVLLQTPAVGGDAHAGFVATR